MPVFTVFNNLKNKGKYIFLVSETRHLDEGAGAEPTNMAFTDINKVDELIKTKNAAPFHFLKID
jgi:hypothetical protein